MRVEKVVVAAILALSAVPTVAHVGGTRTHATEQARATRTVRQLVDRAAAKFFRENPQAVGVTAGVLINGQSHIYSYGTAQPGHNRRPALDTIYPIASITKTFTGTLLAQAAIEHRLNLGDDVRKYLDGEYPNLEFAGHPIRLFDLLDHRSGLPFILPNRPETSPDFHGDNRPWSARIAEIGRTYDKTQFLSDLHAVRLTAEPGSEFKYSNAAAQLAGYILERVYGRPYEVILRDKVLMPLGMSNSGITIQKRDLPRLAVGYDESGRQMPYVPDWLQGAGAIKSTAGDLLKYVRWQMAETDPAVKLSHQPVLTQGSYSAGLNWQILSNSSGRLIWQEGNIEGFNALCIQEPELKIGLVVLSNEEDRKSAHGNSVMANEILSGLDRRAIALP
jgi:CubicO group peptidase (beta-lactamase class C family)